MLISTSPAPVLSPLPRSTRSTRQLRLPSAIDSSSSRTCPILHHAPTRSLFQAALEQHLAQSTLLTSRGVPNVPIVIIVTESAPREDEDGWVAGASSSTWRDRIASIVDTRTVLGERIRRNPAYAEVRYNPIAPSILLKGLKRAVDQAPAQALRNNKPNARLPKDILDLLSAIANDANGDLRAALNCLQFMGASRPQLDHMAKETASKPGRRGRTGVGRMLPLVAGRESSLALFHALGRVLYNKRAGEIRAKKPPPPRPTRSSRMALIRTATTMQSTPSCKAGFGTPCVRLLSRTRRSGRPRGTAGASVAHGARGIARQRRPAVGRPSRGCIALCALPPPERGAVLQRRRAVRSGGGGVLVQPTPWRRCTSSCVIRPWLRTMRSASRRAACCSACQVRYRARDRSSERPRGGMCTKSSPRSCAL